METVTEILTREVEASRDAMERDGLNRAGELAPADCASAVRAVESVHGRKPTRQEWLEVPGIKWVGNAHYGDDDAGMEPGGHGEMTIRTYFQITSKAGVDMGTYEAESAQGALDAMARDAGYRDHVHACEVTGTDGSELEVHKGVESKHASWSEDLHQGSFDVSLEGLRDWLVMRKLVEQADDTEMCQWVTKLGLYDGSVGGHDGLVAAVEGRKLIVQRGGGRPATLEIVDAE